MSASAAPPSTPGGPGYVSGAPNLPAGFTDTFTSRYIDTGVLRQRAAREPGRIEARQGSGKESRECFLEWRPHAGGPGRRLWGAESPRGVHRHRRRSVNELDRGNHFAAWQEPDLFTTEVRAAFRSLR